MGRSREVFISTINAAFEAASTQIILRLSHRKRIIAAPVHFPPKPSAPIASMDTLLQLKTQELARMERVTVYSARTSRAQNGQELIGER